MRVDLHVHSKYSKRPSQWVLQKINCPESFTEPLQIYHIARRRGMSLVTITDHNSIEGALEIAHLPGTFISEEITGYFPEDGCKIHILAYHISEAQHREIQKLRKNIYDLIPWLYSQDICHALAHPLFSINGRLTVTHFEKLLLLFRIFEINGARNPEQNHFLQLILESLTPEDINRLAETHQMNPLMPEPWKKYLVAGSDDHSSMTITQAFTEVEGDASPEMLLDGLRQGTAKITSRPASPCTLAHNLYSIAFQFYKNKLNLKGCVQENHLLRFLENSLTPEGEGHIRLLPRLYSLWRYRLRKRNTHQGQHPLLELLQQETRRFMEKNPHIYEAKSNKKSQQPEMYWFEFVNQVSNRTLCHFADPLMDQLAGADVFNLFQTIGSAGSLYALLSPYFVAFSLFSKDRQLTAKLASQFSLPNNDGNKTDEIRVAHFTDTLYEINGVALTLQQQAATAARNNQNLTIITCDSQPRPNQTGIKNFNPIGIYELPEYPEQKIFYPPLLEMLHYCYEKGITHIHSATPGAIGLAALAIARILKLPITATYHTAIPQYAQFLTGDATIADLTWKYISWYYAQVDIIYVPSQATRNELVDKGLNPAKITLYPRGIDIQRFHPAKRNGFLKHRLNIENAVTILYVGRISREKNLPLLVDVFKALISKHNNLHLVLVGDGPWRNEMQQAMIGLPCTFTGYLSGNDLPTVYASSDLFVFPSNTDTFGNVVLEAQASGIPVIVSNQGGPQENMHPGQSGLVVTENSVEAWVEAIEILLENPEKRRRMGSNARKLMEDRSFEKAHIAAFEMYKHFSWQHAANDC